MSIRENSFHNKNLHKLQITKASMPTTHLDSLLAGEGVSASVAVAVTAFEPLRPLPRPAPPTLPSEVGSRPLRPRPRAGFVGSLNLGTQRKKKISSVFDAN